jgi:hypothetical protein
MQHKIWVKISNTTQWYAIMRECRMMYQKNWRAQSHVRRKLEKNTWLRLDVWCWFEVPDPMFATWVATKHGITAQTIEPVPNK